MAKAAKTKEGQLKVGDRKAFCPTYVHKEHKSWWGPAHGHKIIYFGNEPYRGNGGPNGRNSYWNYVPHKYRHSLPPANMVWLLELIEDYPPTNAIHGAYFWKPVEETA